jgi:hypothetical protein
MSNLVRYQTLIDILRTYDIAAIRTGARPVYANRIVAVAKDDEDTISNKKGQVEIVWQQLINFESVVVGRMMIEVTDTYMKAYRLVEKSSNMNRRQPLPGEDILVRRLADAASQAIEKGLAIKVREHLIFILLYTFLV